MGIKIYRYNHNAIDFSGNDFINHPIYWDIGYQVAWLLGIEVQRSFNMSERRNFCEQVECERPHRIKIDNNDNTALSAPLRQGERMRSKAG